MPALASLHEMERRYGVDLDENSHGQSFLKLFRSRFVPGGLYLLDEPEAPLSPQSQLALLAMIGDMVRAERAVHHRNALANSTRLPERDDLLVRPRADRARAVRGARPRGDHAGVPERAGEVSQAPDGAVIVSTCVILSVAKDHRPRPVINLD